ncbi:hypothetical protein B0H11DRAFT_2269110 [Mycena galericulata]|nr:hypothetical protein B0H11DRAFT_2269110 [Mycena galericulata]
MLSRSFIRLSVLSTVLVFSLISTFGVTFNYASLAVPTAVITIILIVPIDPLRRDTALDFNLRGEPQPHWGVEVFCGPSSVLRPPTEHAARSGGDGGKVEDTSGSVQPMAFQNV